MIDTTRRPTIAERQTHTPPHPCDCGCGSVLYTLEPRCRNCSGGHPQASAPRGSINSHNRSRSAAVTSRPSGYPAGKPLFDPESAPERPAGHIQSVRIGRREPS